MTSGDEIGVVNLTVTQAPGADNIDLENVTVQWVGPSGSYQINPNRQGPYTGDGRFLTSAFKDDDAACPRLARGEKRRRSLIGAAGTHTATTAETRICGGQAVRGRHSRIKLDNLRASSK
jgi:hypothetical protein